MDRDNYQMWTPTKKLKNHYKQHHKSPLAENAAQKTMNVEIAKRLKERLQVTRKNDMVIKLSQDFQHLRENNKREVSYQLEGERELAKHLKIKWSKIVNLAQGVRRMSDTYFQNYDELAPLLCR